MKPNIVIFNGSINTQTGNTHLLLKKIEDKFDRQSNANYKRINLDSDSYELKSILEWADGFIFATGTYWDSWGSPMQKLIESLTVFEANEEILFKPCITIVTMHAFGGKEVMSRLQGILNTMGFIIPPMGGFVYSLATQEALKNNPEFAMDFWSIEDLDPILFNLFALCNHRLTFKSWEVDKKDPKRRWFTC